MPRFVILDHDHPVRHWDLMLECGPVLRTWRLPACPVPGSELVAEPSFEHRLLYLDYEGPVSGNRGDVRRWDAGEFVWLAHTQTEIVADFRGQVLRGPVRLQALADGRWRCSAPPIAEP